MDLAVEDIKETEDIEASIVNLESGRGEGRSKGSIFQGWHGVVWQIMMVFFLVGPTFGYEAMVLVVTHIGEQLKEKAANIYGCVGVL